MRTLSLNRRLSPAFLLTFLGLLVVQSASARAGGVGAPDDLLVEIDIHTAPLKGERPCQGP